MSIQVIIIHLSPGDPEQVIQLLCACVLYLDKKNIDID